MPTHGLPSPPACLFVVRLLPAAPGGGAGEAPACIGQLEHVLSGRRHDFADGAALLECLAHEQRRASVTQAPVAPPRPPA